MNSSSGESLSGNIPMDSIKVQCRFNDLFKTFYGNALSTAFISVFFYLLFFFSSPLPILLRYEGTTKYTK